ncbi:MAG: hypothetical protein FJW88_06065 [Actinobacteria bacterium]|nr:hypothetical protein [Actinomycetota bacterium]
MSADNIKFWGWGALISGVILVLVGIGIFSGASWARVVGIVVASINLLYQFTYLGTGWSSWIMIVIDILVIYGLAGHRFDQLEDA